MYENIYRVVNMSGVKKLKIRDEWRKKEKNNEDEDEEADGGNRTIERKNDVIFYENVLASGKFYQFSKSEFHMYSVTVSQEGVRSVQRTDLYFAICRFSQVRSRTISFSISNSFW